jgi:tetratricopeptide (TPR) repeat protein
VEAMLAVKQYAAAVKATTALLGMSPTAKVYLLRGQARLGSGDLSGSLNDGGRALSLNPDLPGAIRLLGDTHSRAGKSKKALFYYRLFLARTPVKSSTARQRAEVLRMIKGL